MATIALKDVRKSYGQAAVVHGIDLTIAEGEFVVLVGPSGCGKSTLLRMIAGLEDITSGTLSIGGRVVNGAAPSERDIAMVFQDYALYPNMTVAENVGFGLSMRDVAAPDIARRVAETAKVLKIDALLARKPAQLSGGQRQRVAMGRAIVRKPTAFLFDEPLSNLDTALRVEMRLEMARLHRTLGVTTVYVTHDQVEAMTLADRIVVMNGGRIEQVGAPLDLYEKPASLFVARFIGSPPMNLLDPGILQAVPVIPGAVTLGVRPEDLHPVETGGSLGGDIAVVERLGSQTFAYVEIAGALVAVEWPKGRPCTVGDSVELALDPARLHAFDAGGRRMSVAV